MQVAQDQQVVLVGLAIPVLRETPAITVPQALVVPVELAEPQVMLETPETTEMAAAEAVEAVALMFKVT